ncbi:hypothetical protein CX649_08805 [Bacillaceae bacterium ZC4]|uniref:Uncharacterized protein n=1 Tax=Aeribacillus pallidus TaxID=33936 RepID=A0A165Y218_9BACI|nr:hypothetical protein AP3564_14580 [Aeribacillus pallidus]AXI39722.1 hypothetical protein CX649_08805 [Bacillaceae bacterium ZC4]KZN96642.1 hypothetical protein AZI98_07485 [Aeribacillus pallidus]REJ22226.1 MAG: hypothetical protein C6W54_15565 [Bacillaceae bacterium]
MQQTTENFLFHLMSEQRNGKKIKNLNFIPLVLNKKSFLNEILTYLEHFVKFFAKRKINVIERKTPFDHEGLMKIDILRLEAVFFPALEK